MKRSPLAVGWPQRRSALLAGRQSRDPLSRSSWSEEVVSGPSHRWRGRGLKEAEGKAPQEIQLTGEGSGLESWEGHCPCRIVGGRGALFRCPGPVCVCGVCCCRVIHLFRPLIAFPVLFCYCFFFCCLLPVPKSSTGKPFSLSFCKVSCKQRRNSLWKCNGMFRFRSLTTLHLWNRRCTWPRFSTAYTWTRICPTSSVSTHTLLPWRPLIPPIAKWKQKNS